MRLYERADMTGQMHELVDDCPNVQDQLSMSDFNSCNVMDGHWLLYDQPNYKGRVYYLRPGEYRRYSDWGGISPRIGSIRRITDFNWSQASFKCIFQWLELSVFPINFNCLIKQASFISTYHYKASLIFCKGPLRWQMSFFLQSNVTEWKISTLWGQWWNNLSTSFWVTGHYSLISSMLRHTMANNTSPSWLAR